MDLDINQNTSENIGLLLSILILVRSYFSKEASSNCSNFNENDNYLNLSDWG